MGIQLYAVREDLQAQPLRTLRAVRQMGFDEVETAGFAGLSAQRFRELLDDAGLKCPSAHLQFERRSFDSEFEQAHALGARYAAQVAACVTSCHPRQQRRRRHLPRRCRER